MHRQCAGIPRPVFQALRESSEQFFCVYCSNKKILVLNQSVKSLVEEVALLKSQLSSSATTCNRASHDNSGNQSPSFASIVSAQACHHPPVSSSQTVSDQVYTPTFVKLPAPSESKFKFVIYGIKEQPSGSLRRTRLADDSNEVAKVVRELDNSIAEDSIQDCTRLGKFSGERKRPILVKLSHSCHVLSILSQRSKLRGTGVSIKPEMTPNQLKIESILMKKRWVLIQSGITRNVIKIKGTSLYVNNLIIGSVVNFEFVDSAVDSVVHSVVDSVVHSSPQHDKSPKPPQSDEQ